MQLSLPFTKTPLGDVAAAQLGRAAMARLRLTPDDLRRATRTKSTI